MSTLPLWLRTSVAVGALVLGCAHARPPLEPEVAQSEQQLAREMSALQATTASAAGVDCPRAGTLRDNVCTLAERICALVARDPAIANGPARCQDARLRCAEARRRVDASCRPGGR